VRAGVNSVVGCPVSKKQAVYYFENNSWSNPRTRPRIRMTSCLASNVPATYGCAPEPETCRMVTPLVRQAKDRLNEITRLGRRSAGIMPPSVYLIAWVGQAAG